MKKLLTLLFLLFSPLLAFNSIEVSNPDITLHKYGYFKTDKQLTQSEAFKYTEENSLSQLPKAASSFGFDSDTYWFRFDVSTTSEEHFVLAARNLVATSCELFVFEGGKQTRHDISGYEVPPEKRPIDSIALRFYLEANKPNVTYLVKVSSKNPHYASFGFGKSSQVDKAYSILNFITTATFAMCVVMIFYNLSLFFVLKDTTYLYYCIYIGGLFALDICVLGFLPILSQSLASIDLGVLVGLFLQIEYAGLTLFTIKFLRLDQNDPKLKKRLQHMLLFTIGAAFFVPIGHGLEKIAVFAINALAMFLLYAAIKTYLRGYKPALFYLLATGVGLVCFILFMNMNQGGGIPFGVWSFNLVSFGLIWDMIFLFLAIAHRIKLVQEEKEQALKLIAQKAKFTTIGETLSNIAHQWRQPLSEIGASTARLEFEMMRNGSVSSERIKQMIRSNKETIAGMSKTIETFQDFFHQSTDGQFEIGECIDGALTFMQGQLEHLGIKVSMYSDGKRVVDGSADEFFQALVIMLSNAKDALIENKSKNPKIDIKVLSDSDTVTLTIEDNGGGIKLPSIQEIFEPYASTKGLNGMGIGLYTAKMIIEEKMGGKISAENTKEGARFLLSLGSQS
jgi:two-component system, sensor histidine kinase LadS